MARKEYFIQDVPIPDCEFVRNFQMQLILLLKKRSLLTETQAEKYLQHLRVRAC